MKPILAALALIVTLALFAAMISLLVAPDIQPLPQSIVTQDDLLQLNGGVR
ncbi:MAG: hypothetical protein R3D71_05780 [Rickettsiales bacterium]